MCWTNHKFLHYAGVSSKIDGEMLLRSGDFGDRDFGVSTGLHLAGDFGLGIFLCQLFLVSV